LFLHKQPLAKFSKDIDCFIDNSFIGAKNAAVANFEKQHSFRTISCIFVHLSGRFVQEILDTSKLHLRKLRNKKIQFGFWGDMDQLVGSFKYYNESFLKTWIHNLNYTDN
jgi:hypothetical protein